MSATYNALNRFSQRTLIGQLVSVKETCFFSDFLSPNEQNKFVLCNSTPTAITSCVDLFSSSVKLNLAPVQLRPYSASCRDLEDSSLIKRNSQVPSQTFLVFLGFCFGPYKPLLTMAFLLRSLFFHLIQYKVHLFSYMVQILFLVEAVKIG